MRNAGWMLALRREIDVRQGMARQSVRGFAFVATAASSVALTAQTAQAPAPAKPSLIGNVSPSSSDSPLVRAAKATVAARMREAARSTGVVINESYMKTHDGGRVSEAHSSAELPPLPRQQTAGASQGAPAAAPEVDHASIERKQQQLRQEQARAAAEMNEPYGGNNGMEEDHAQQRSTQIPQEIQKNQQQMNRRP